MRNRFNLDRKKYADSLEDAMRFRIFIDNEHGEIEGTGLAIMTGLSMLVKHIINNSYLTEKDIKLAVDVGLKGEEEIKKDIMKKLQKFLEL